MTKIKNTKKGMAKKTLSMSLVVAMLATSNVPVWAAEFSDGTDTAVTSEAEAFSADEELPVVEDEIVDTAKANNPTISVEGINGTEIKCGGSDALKVTTGYTTDDANYYKLTYKFTGDTKETQIGEIFTSDNRGTAVTGTIPALKEAQINKDLTVSVYENTTDNFDSIQPKATRTYKIIGADKSAYFTTTTPTWSFTGVNAGNQTINKGIVLGATLTGVTPNTTAGAAASLEYEFYDDDTKLSSPVDTASLLGHEITVKAVVDTQTTAYGKVTVAESAPITVISDTAADYATIGYKAPSVTSVAWNSAKSKSFDDLFEVTSSVINVKDITKTLKVTKGKDAYILTGTDADKDAVITPVISFKAPGSEKIMTIEGAATVSVSEIVPSDISGIGLEDQQWRDSANGTLLERGKMPEYTYKNSNKESYKPVLEKVWIGETEYTVGGQNVVAVHTYPTDPVTGPNEKCKVNVALTINGVTGNLSQEYKVKATSFKETDVTWPASLTYAPTKEFNEAVINATSVAGLTKLDADGDNADTAQYKVEVATVGNQATITVTGLHEYSGTSFHKTVTIDKYNIANAYVAPIEDKEYKDGADVTPEVTVKYKDEKSTALTLNTDYTVAYQTNRDAGTATVIITGNGMYEGSKTVTFNIVSKKFTSDITTAFDNELKTALVYNAKEQKPLDKDITTAKSLKLKYLSDFSTSYVNNVDAGTATVTVKGVGNYAGATYTSTFKINKAQLSTLTNKDITVEDTTYSKDLLEGELGKSIKPAVTVKFNGTTLRQGIDYDIAYANAGTTGKRTVEVTLTGTAAANSNFEGTKTVSGKVISKELSTVTIPSIPSQVYQNKEYTLNDIKLSDGTLFKDGIKDGKTPLTTDDYYVSAYKNNKETGTATILLAGKGDYKGTVTVTFPIDAQEMNAKFVYTEGNGSDKTDFDGVPDLPYNYDAAESKKGITHADGAFRVVLTADSGNDKKGTTVNSGKYTIKYTENKAVGTATIEAVGKDGYSLNAKTTFKITPKAITDLGSKISYVTVAGDTLHYTGEEQKPKVTVDYTVDGHKLVEGTDYEVSYTDNVNASTGKAKVVIKGLGNYVIGETDDKAAKNEGYSKTFDIVKTDIVNSNVTVKDVPYAGGVQVTPDVTIVNPYSGKELVQGTDYTVALKGDNTTEVGTSSVEVALTAAGKENYTISGVSTNTMRFNFNITAKDLSKVDVAPIADQTATGEQIKPAVTVTNGKTKLVEGKDYEVSYGENKEVGEGTVTIKALDSNKNYIGSQTVKFNIVEKEAEVGQAMISNVIVKGNTVTPVLSGEVDGAVGYDYVIATEEDYKNGRVDISKNVLTTNTNFYYVQKGTYYVYCHAWKRGADNKKVFGEWSNIYKFTVKATTPSTPKIKIDKVTVKGNTVTVTYTKSSNATGYDVILGSAVKSVNGEKRPVDYGTLVKKNIKGNVVTATFKNVPAGTYYAGVHAFNKTSEDGKKVFSKWSNSVVAEVE